MKEQKYSYSQRIGKTTFIVNVKQSESAKKPLNIPMYQIAAKAIQNLCKGKTVIVVAHRLSALKMCNRVAVVENHTITSVGTHEEVRKNNAYYRNLFRSSNLQVRPAWGFSVLEGAGKGTVTCTPLSAAGSTTPNCL